MYAIQTSRKRAFPGVVIAGAESPGVPPRSVRPGREQRSCFWKRKTLRAEWADPE